MYETKQFVAKIAISWYFLVEGLCMGNWAASIPIVKDEYNIDEGILGNVLFAAAGGALVAVPLVTYLSSRYGSLLTTLYGSLMMCLVFPIVGIHSNKLISLVIGAFLLGFSLLVLDSSMNTQAVLLELAIDKPILGHFHAVYAIGCVIGGLIGGTLFEFNLSLFIEYIGFSVVVLIPNVIFSFFLFTFHEEITINQHHATQVSTQQKQTLLNALSCSWFELKEVVKNQTTPAPSPMHSNLPESEKQQSKKNNSLSLLKISLISSPERKEYSTLYKATNAASRIRNLSITSNNEPPNPEEKKDYYSLIVICCLLFIGYFGEGSIGDWSALYLTTEWDCSPLVATLGYIGFQVSIAIGRFYCDRIVVTLGRRKLLICSGIIAGSGLLIASLTAVILPENPVSLLITIIGFSICGIGLSVLSPTGISIIGTGVNGFSSSTSIAIASSLGYVGVLVGPPILGNIAVLCQSLSWSFLVDACLISCISIFTLLLPLKYYQLPSTTKASDDKSNATASISIGSHSSGGGVGGRGGGSNGSGTSGGFGLGKDIETMEKEYKDNYDIL
jgi:MFS family permease